MKRGLKVFSPEEISALRIFAGGIFLLPLSVPQLKRLHYKHYKLLFLSGVIGILIPAFLSAKAQTQLDSAINGVLNSLTPVFVLLVGVIFFQRKILRSEAIGAVLGVKGSILLMFIEAWNQVDKFNYYALLPVLGTFLYGNNINLTKYHLQELTSKTIASVSLLLMGVAAGIFLFTQTTFLTKLQTAEGAYHAMGYVLILGIVGLGIAQLLFATLIKLASPVFASSISFFIPIVALMWGLLDGELLLWGHYLGIVIILLGIHFVSKTQATEKLSQGMRPTSDNR